MSDVTIELLNRRAAIAAVRQEATRAGVDGDALLDSRRVHDQLATLDPDEPGFTGRIREIVSNAAARLGGSRAAAPPAAAGSPQGVQRSREDRERPRQWTIEDVRGATPSQCAEAMEAGLLTDLGVPRTRRRR